MNPMTDLLGTICVDGQHATATFDRRYDTDAADLWDAVTTPERLGRWFAPVSGDLREGGTFTIGFDDGDVGGCRVTRCDPPVGYDWLWPHADHASEVHVEIHSDGDASRLVVRHSGLATASAPAYAAGWQAHLLALGAHVDGEESAGWWEDFALARDAYAAQLGDR